MSNPKTVAIIHGRFLPYHVARIRAAHEHFSGRGYSVLGIEISATSQAYSWDIDTRQSGIRSVTLFEDRNYSEMSYRTLATRLWRLLETENPSAVAFGWSFAETYTVLAWCKFRRRIAVALSESKVDDMGRFRWKEALKRLLIKRFSAALVGGRSHAEYAASLGIPRERCFFGYDVVDNDFFARAADAARCGPGTGSPLGDPQQPYFLTAARFIREKNLPRAIRAYAAYARRVGPDAWPWIVCGDGPLRGDVERTIAECGIEDGIVLAGPKQYDELPRYHAFAGAFWLPSEKDGWGLAVNEAMAAGLPVLVSNQCGCAAELVEPGANGWSFDAFDISEMAGALERMHALSPEARRKMADESRRIIAHWGPQRFATGLADAVAAASGGRL